MTTEPGASSLDGTVAVVTGASRGLGRGIALSLETGATVYVIGRSRRGGETTIISPERSMPPPRV